ncbi:MAG: hypothetical protein ABIP06_14375 [Pyrinomonadaceae bacterium]
MTDKKKPVKGNGVKTNKTNGSLVKTIVFDDVGKWIQPKSGDKFFIDEDAIFPKITFEIETQELAPYEWSCSISWPAAASGLKESVNRGKTFKTFTDKVTPFSQSEKSWIVAFDGKILGGTVTVQVKAGKEIFKRFVYIRGKNPGKDRTVELLNTIDGVKGFEKLLAQESKFKNFIDADNMPVVALIRAME